jgi:hypothetical protein
LATIQQLHTFWELHPIFSWSWHTRVILIAIPHIFNKNYSNTWFYKKKHISANLISITGLVGWEFLQLSGKLKFDWNDILWTLIGATLFQFIWIISPRKYKEI